MPTSALSQSRCVLRHGRAVAIPSHPVPSPRRAQGQDGDGRSEEEDRVREHSRSSNGDGNGKGNGDGNGTCRPFSWKKDELEGLSLSTPSPGGGLVLVAADVIYDEGLTDAFFRVLRMLMPVPAAPPVPVGRQSGDKLAGDCSDNATRTPKDEDANYGGGVDQTPSASVDSAGSEAAASGKKSTISDENVPPGAKGKAQAVLYLALEKRFNFSIAELSVAATGYSALLRNVLDITQQAADSGGAGVDRSAQQGENALKDFEGRRLPLSFQQCFRYTRNDAMELWEIRRRPMKRPKT